MKDLRHFLAICGLLTSVITVGLAQSAKPALADLSRLADQGNPDAQLALGIAYGCGQGHPVAQRYLSRMVFDGKGVQQDHAEAVAWLSKAAGQG